MATTAEWTNEAGLSRSHRSSVNRRARNKAARACLLTLLGLTAAGMTGTAHAKQGPGDRWAAIKTDGTVLRHKGVVGVAYPPGTNTYIVSFDREVTDCIYLATLDSSNGLVTTVRSVADATGVFVTTHTRKGADKPRSFVLHVVCD